MKSGNHKWVQFSSRSYYISICFLLLLSGPSLAADETNAKLRNKSKGVARGSLHMQGKALDFRMPGTDTAVLRDTARKMKRGEVGYYKKSDFVQIDTPAGLDPGSDKFACYGLRVAC